MTKILLTGKNGQVGWELQRTLTPLGNIIALGRPEMDLASPDSIRKAIREARPNIIVNAAAYTAVDQAESEPDIAMAVNGIAPGIIAEEAKRLNAALIHYSTDYVFDGAKTVPYTEEDAPNPLNVYGKTKLAGEQAIQAAGVPYLIFRTSWVYSARGKNFLLTILRLVKEKKELRIVDDQTGAPTWSRMIAETTAQILAKIISAPVSGNSRFTFHVSRFTEVTGIYHLTAAGQTTWYGFTKAILEGAPGAPRVTPISSRDYPTTARRPANSLLANTRLETTFGVRLADWRFALQLCLKDNIRTLPVS